MQTTMTGVKNAWERPTRGLKFALLLGAVPILVACNNAGSQGTSADLAQAVAAQAKTMETLQKRVQTVEDVQAITNLENAYGFYVDKHLWHQVIDLFSEDATVEISDRGIFVGKEGVSRIFLDGLGGGKVGLDHGQLYNHIQVEGVVNVAPDGQHAKGRFRAMVQVASAKFKSATLSDGIYENEFVKKDGVWMFSKMRFWPTYYTPYKEGWGGKQAQCINGNGTGMSKGADKPSTDHASVFPDIYYPPFHYNNPVSGKPVDVSKLNEAAKAEYIWPKNCQGGPAGGNGVTSGN